MNRQGSNLSRRESSRGRRSLSCFELQGRQLLHASHSFPPSHLHTSLSSHLPPSPHSPHSLTSRSHSVQGLCNRKLTKSRELQVHTTLVSHAEPDYQLMARRRKQFALAAKTVTAEKILQPKVPEGETLHNFLIGGRYNSAHHVDSRSLQRLGVYIPRSKSAKTFINPAGTTPPSPAVYGMHPLKKHMPRIYPPPSPPCSLSCDSRNSERSLFLIKQDLEMRLRGEANVSSCSLPSERYLLDNGIGSQDSDVNSIMKQEEKSQGKNQGASRQIVNTSLKGKQEGQEEEGHICKDPVGIPVVTNGAKGEISAVDSKVCQPPQGQHQNHRLVQEREQEGGSEGASEGASEGGSEGSNSDLLSPEAQLLTQEILLETDSLFNDFNPSLTRNFSRTTRRLPPTSFVKQVFFAEDHTHPGLKTESTSTSYGHPTKTLCPDQTSRHQLPDQMSRHQLPGQTFRQVSAKQTFKWDLIDPLSMEQSTGQTYRKCSKSGVALSQYVPTRPKSAMSWGQVVSVHRNDKLPNRPQSAMQISKAAAENEVDTKFRNTAVEKNTIFIDLSRLHPLEIDNSDIEDGK